MEMFDLILQAVLKLSFIAMILVLLFVVSSTLIKDMKK